ncbi:MAG: hypothetical protein ABGX22_08530, partial [Pirellulaceae bacterium]
MTKRSLLQVILFSMLVSLVGAGLGEEPSQLIRVWPDFAPGETTKSPGEALPRRLNENPPATRITKITAPQLEVYAASKETASGAAVLI